MLAAAPAAAEVLYRLPWPEGRGFTITQAPGGKITTHFAKSSLYAVDIAMPEGTPVLAARRGTVSDVESRHGGDGQDGPITDGGNYVLVRHEDDTIATYAHLKHRGVAVEPGDRVEAGQLLGYSGSTGYSSGPHLHFGVSRMEETPAGKFEASVPVMFYIGVPPVAFGPRAGLIVTPNYSSAAEFPRMPSETRLTPWTPPPPLSAEQLPIAWMEFAAWLVAGLLGLVWFWKFSRS